MTDTRWLQRLDNFDRAFLLLEEVCERGMSTLSPLEKEGAVQRFEILFELAWKTLRDYLGHIGVTVQPVAPRAVIKEAFAAGLLDNAQVWIDMMVDRNLLAHTYENALMEDALRRMETKYFPALSQLHDFFHSKR